MSPSRGVVACLLALFLGGGALAVRSHLGFNFHTAVEFMFRHAAFALGVTFFFNRVEDATQFGEPL